MESRLEHMESKAQCSLWSRISNFGNFAPRDRTRTIGNLGKKNFFFNIASKVGYDYWPASLFFEHI